MIDLGDGSGDALKALQSGNLAPLLKQIPQDEHWQKVLVQLASEGLDKFGSKGIEKAREALLGGVMTQWVSLRVSSDLLAVLQNGEADKRKADTFLQDLGNILSKVGSVLLAALL